MLAVNLPGHVRKTLNHTGAHATHCSARPTARTSWPYKHEWQPSISATLQGCPHYTLPPMCMYKLFEAGTRDPHNGHVIPWTVRATTYRRQRTTMKYRSTYMHATYLIVPSAKQPILGQSVIASKLQLTLSCRATWLCGYFPFLLFLQRKGGMLAAVTSPKVCMNGLHRFHNGKHILMTIESNIDHLNTDKGPHVQW